MPLSETENYLDVQVIYLFVFDSGNNSASLMVDSVGSCISAGAEMIRSLKIQLVVCKYQS